MNARGLAAAAAATMLSSVPAFAQKVPETPAEVARPGGTIPAAGKVALVKIADGFNDPVGVSVANDGSGRVLSWSVGRVKVVKDGKVLPQPFLDLTNINPLGTDVQTGFVEQGLWSIAFIQVQGERPLLRPLFLSPVQRGRADRALHGR